MTLLESIGLRTNRDKTKVMTCVPGNIRVAHTEEACYMQQYGPVNLTAKHYQVECNICDVSLAAGSLCSHMETQQDAYWSFVFNRELTIEHEAVVYQATTDATGTIFCLVPACMGVVGSKAALRSHFLQRHPHIQQNVDYRSCMQPRMADTMTLPRVRMGWQGKYSMPWPNACT